MDFWCCSGLIFSAWFVLSLYSLLQLDGIVYTQFLDTFSSQRDLFGWEVFPKSISAFEDCHKFFMYCRPCETFLWCSSRINLLNISSSIDNRRTIYPHTLNNGSGLKLLKGYKLQQASEEGWMVQWSKCYDNNQDEDNSLNSSMNNNDDTSFKKFRQKCFHVSL